MATTVKEYTLNLHLKHSSTEIRELYNLLNKGIMGLSIKDRPINLHVVKSYIGYTLGKNTIIGIFTRKNKLVAHIGRTKPSDAGELKNKLIESNSKYNSKIEINSEQDIKDLITILGMRIENLFKN